jgi:hypothetical protein
LDAGERLILSGLAGLVSLEHEIDELTRMAGAWVRILNRWGDLYCIEGHVYLWSKPASLGITDLGFFQDRRPGFSVASAQVIEHSVAVLDRFARMNYHKTIALEFPGVAHGLAETEVAPLLSPLPDNVMVYLRDRPGGV